MPSMIMVPVGPMGRSDDDVICIYIFFSENFASVYAKPFNKFTDLKLWVNFDNN